MISIIIPTYNSERTIKRCLDSIVEQTFHDWEVLLMDGVSKDNTLSIAVALAVIRDSWSNNVD